MATDLLAIALLAIELLAFKLLIKDGLESGDMTMLITTLQVHVIQRVFFILL